MIFVLLIKKYYYYIITLTFKERITIKMCKKVAIILSIIVLLGAIGYSAYKAYDFNELNNELINEFNKDGECRFISSNYTIDENRLVIKAIAVVNEITINITLYYPIRYLQNFYFYKYNEEYFEEFYQTLKNETFNCKVDTIDVEAYFNDYNEYPSIFEFLNVRNIELLFIYLLIVFGGLFICLITYLLVSYYYVNKKDRFPYMDIEF